MSQTVNIEMRVLYILSVIDIKGDIVLKLIRRRERLTVSVCGTVTVASRAGVGRCCYRMDESRL